MGTQQVEFLHQPPNFPRPFQEKGAAPPGPMVIPKALEPWRSLRSTLIPIASSILTSLYEQLRPHIFGDFAHAAEKSQLKQGEQLTFVSSPSVTIPTTTPIHI